MIRNNIQKHQNEVRPAEANHGVCNNPLTAKSLAKAKRDLNASLYQMKYFENANADNSRLGWPADNYFSDQAAQLRKTYIGLRDDYQLKKNSLGSWAKRALKKKRDHAHVAYRSFTNRHSNIFGTGALDMEARYRANHPAPHDPSPSSPQSGPGATSHIGGESYDVEALQRRLQALLG